LSLQQLLTNLVVVSGGQTGVDRAALDWALHNKIPSGGWCPKGRVAEDGVIPARYPLRETWSAEYDVRTEYNVRDSSATLIIYRSMMSKGSLLTKKFCLQYQKPFLEIDLGRDYRPEEIAHWLDDKRIETLNIAGPRESQSPGIYIATMELLNSVYNIIVTA
jgi:hypothetical protein